LGFLSSSIGKKYVMGAAGLGWTLFVAGHMAGNLLIFAGPEAFNRYGHAIVSNKPLLYGTEVFLVVCLLLHVGLGIKLTIENKAAKPKKYAQSPVSQKSASLASKTMAIHGSIILFFIIYHLITFKWGPVYWVEYQGETMRDLFRLVTEVFSSPAYVVGYIVCLFLLGLHLSHGASSVFQSFGWNHPRYRPIVQTGAWAYAIIVAGGFIAQPIYVFFFL
jgi:succinate dehydrogenase / fumarate reductase, cytochrome b subunit